MSTRASRTVTPRKEAGVVPGEHEVTATFREVLGPGSEVYAGLLASLLIGVTFGRRVARTGVLAELTREEPVGYLAPAIRALIAPAIAAAEGGG